LDQDFRSSSFLLFRSIFIADRNVAADAITISKRESCPIIFRSTSLP